MKPTIAPEPPGPFHRQKGISLIIVLIMMVVIGLTAASAMRSATSGQRVTNNARMDTLATQYAEAALRYCEAQLQIPDANLAPLPVRVNSLKDANIPTTTFVASGWGQTATWVGVGGASATKTALPSAQFSTAGVSTNVPTTAPECVVERQVIGSPTFAVTVVTARGFSPDYEANVNGTTKRGSVVWLQSILNL
jgi:type IV pilus assembly protein PilX